MFWDPCLKCGRSTSAGRRNNPLRASRSGRSVAALLLSVFVLSARAPMVRAEPRGKSATPAERAAAQALFDQARQLMKRGAAEQACPKLEESQRLDAGLGTQYHLASCYEAVGRTASAYALFLAVAAAARDAGQQRREDVARERAEAVEAKLSHLRIVVPNAQASQLSIQRDGSSIGRAQLGSALPVDPGVHTVTASGEGFAPWETEVVVPARPGVVTVSVPPLHAYEETSFWAPPTRKVGAAALGIGVASLGLGTAFAVRALSKNEESNRAGCVDDDCPTRESLALRNAALTAGNRATWAFGVGASGIAAGTVLFLWVPEGGDSDPESMRVGPVAYDGGGGLRLQGNF